MNNSFYWLAQSYNDNKLLRLMLKLLPYGDLSDNILSSFYTKEKERRLKIFLDEVNKGNISLTEEDILSDTFLHKFYLTLKAVTETRRTEKIHLFAHLLLNSTSSLLNHEYDNYEDFIKILDDLSFQEIYILNVISKLEIQNNITVAYKSIGLYKTMVKTISTDLSISKNETESLLIRLSRSGLIIYNKGNVYQQEVHNYVITTDLFKKLKTLISLNNNAHSILP